MHSRPTRITTLALFAVLLLAVAGTTGAQPFGSWTLWDRSDSGANYFEIPHSPALNPVSEITIEGWVAVADGGGCSNIIGKNWQAGWWVGVCGNLLRSYLRGLTDVSLNAGDIGASGWHHFAVTYDGSQHCHFIDGREAACVAASGNLAATTDPVRIGGDVRYQSFTLSGAINELRLWSVARTVEQIRATINVPLTSPMPGLVAVWDNGNADDALGNHDGFMVGSVPALTFPVAVGCSNTATSLCAHNRFVVSISYDGGLAGSGQATRTNPSTFRSGIFWFFNATNWEVMVKVLNGCAFTNRWWVFSAATTNVFYRMEVFDQEAGRNKVYFNYPGPPAPAVTDTNAFATCP